MFIISNYLNISVLPIDGTLTDISAQSNSGPESNGNIHFSDSKSVVLPSNAV